MKKKKPNRAFSLKNTNFFFCESDYFPGLHCERLHLLWKSVRMNQKSDIFYWRLWKGRVFSDKLRSIAKRFYNTNQDVGVIDIH